MADQLTWSDEWRRLVVGDEPADVPDGRPRYAAASSVVSIRRVTLSLRVMTEVPPFRPGRSHSLRATAPRGDEAAARIDQHAAAFGVDRCPPTGMSASAGEGEPESERATSPAVDAVIRPAAQERVLERSEMLKHLLGDGYSP